MHHAYCGHEGERCIAGVLVDGMNRQPCFNITDVLPTVSTPMLMLVKYSCKRGSENKKIKDAGYKLVVVWECDKPKRENTAIPESQTVVYPAALRTTLRPT
jgi:hypothetical protein